MATQLPDTNEYTVMRLAIAFELVQMSRDNNGDVDQKRLDSLLSGLNRALDSLAARGRTKEQGT